MEEFVSLHRLHGALTPDAGAPAANGYMLTLACRCGVTFMRWVTPDDASLDLALLHLHSGNRCGALVSNAALGSSPPQCFF